MFTQATNTVKQWVRESVLLSAIEQRTKTDTAQYAESRTLADTIKARIVYGDLLSTEQKIQLAEYILEYHVDYHEIAQEALDTLDSAARVKES